MLQEPSALRMDDLAPVAVYTYMRYEHLVRTIEALKMNVLARYTVLYVVSDGPSIPAHAAAVKRIREYVDGVTGFREVVRVYREKNLGIKLSPPSAEKAILADHGKIINMEDDNISSTNFLNFMNGGLQHFEHDASVYSISGYRPPVAPVAGDTADFWFYPWNISWGYGVWKAKHDQFHPLNNRYPAQRRSGQLRAQNAAGGLYISDSLKRDFEGKKYFPDAVLCTDMFLSGARTVVPTISKIRNTGQDGSGQSSALVTDKFDVLLDETGQEQFDFLKESAFADTYRRASSDLYNGGPLTRLARQFGVYHELSALRAKLAGTLR